MKKKLTAMLLTLALSAGVLAPVPVYAEDITVGATSMSSAMETKFNTDYTIAWDNNDSKYWNKITLEQQGILRIHLNKEPESANYYVIVVYSEKGKKIWKITMDCAGTAIDNYVGLAKGTYYVSMESVYHFEPSTTYQFSFEKNNACEIEPDGEKNNANGMKVNTIYTGFMGNTYGDSDEDEDLYTVTLKKGQCYKFICDAVSHKEKTTIVKLLGKKTELTSFWPSTEAKNFCVASGDVFVAPYTGTYYGYVRNYYGKQYKYKIGVENVNLKTPKVSVSAAKGSAKVSWSKIKNCSYEVQYATNSKFQGAKKISVSSKKLSATIKHLTSKKKYYVRVRSCISVKKNANTKVYSAWSKTKTVTVK